MGCRRSREPGLIDDKALPTIFNVYSTDFDGVNDAAENSSLSFSGIVSFSLWVKVVSSTDPIIICDKAIYNHLGIGAYIRGTTIEMYGSGGDYATADGSTLADLGWHHVALVWNGTVATCYIDAVDETIDTTVSAVTGGAENFGIRDIGVKFTKGRIDEFAIFDGTALGSTAVTTLYNSGSPGDPTDVAGCDHWYRMGDGDTFPTIKDRVGSEDLTMVNMASNDFVEDVA